MKTRNCNCFCLLSALLFLCLASCNSADSSTSTDAASGDADNSESTDSAETAAAETDEESNAITALDCYQETPTSAPTDDASYTEAVSACEGRKISDDSYCFAHRMSLRDSEGNGVGSFICQPGPCGDGDVAIVQWLGPDYGCAGTATILALPGWLGYGGQPDGCPDWTPEMLDDALAMDISDVPCEEITDYRTCVRSIVPPDKYCQPIIETDDPDDKFGTSRFVGCKTDVDDCGFSDVP